MKSWLFAIAVIGAVACGGNDDKNGDNTNGSGLTITVAPTSVSMQPGGSQNVTVSIGRTGAVVGATVQLAVNNALNGVSATLSSASTTADTVTLTVSAQAGTQPVTGTINVTAQALAADPNAITSASVVVIVGTPSTINVSGKVVSADLIPLSGVTVNVWGHGATTPQTVSTNASGVFTATNVAAPYDVKLSTLGVSGLQALWLGLTRADPVLSVVRVATGPSSASQVSLSFSGGQGFGPQPANTLVAYTVGCPQAGANGDTNLATDIKTLEGTVTGAQDCTINALQHHTASGQADILSFGTATIRPSASGSTAQSVALTNIDMHDVTVTGAAESGDPLSHATMLWVNQSRIVQLGDVTNQGGGYLATIKAPADEALGVMMVFTQDVGTTQVNIVKHLSASVTTLDVIVPPAPTVISPTNGIIDPATLSFNITGAASSGYVYFIGSTPGDQLLYIATTDTTLPVSTLTARGMTLETAQSYHWQYYTFSNVASADDLASTQATPAGYLATDGASFSLSVPGTFSTP